MLARLLRFLFHAEDGIPNGHVTGVQTCALPISTPSLGTGYRLLWGARMADLSISRSQLLLLEIGRASCRERVVVSVFGGTLSIMIRCSYVGISGSVVCGLVGCIRCASGLAGISH